MATDTLNTDTALSAPSAALKTVESKGMSSNLRVPFDVLNVLPDFNVRVVNDEYKAAVRAIADSIKANGYYEYKPLAVFKIDGKDGLFIHDGHTRYDALKLLRDEGTEIADVPVALAPAGTTVEDLIVSLVQSNEGRQLAPLELAIVAKRLLGFGMDKDKVAERLGKTTRYLDNLLVLAGAPKAVRDAVGQNKIAAAEAVKIVRKDPKTAADTVKAKVKEAEAKGKAKATPKTAAATPATPMKRVVVEVDVKKGDKLGDILKDQIAKSIRGEFETAKAGDLVEDEVGKIVLTIHVPDYEKIASREAAEKAKAEKAAAPKPEKKATETKKADATKPVAKGGSTRKTAEQAKAAAKAHLGGDKAAPATETPATGDTAAPAPDQPNAPQGEQAPVEGGEATAPTGTGDDGMGGL